MKNKHKFALLVLGILVLASVALVIIIQIKRSDCAGAACVSNLKINTNYATPMSGATSTASLAPSATPAAKDDFNYKNTTYNFEITLSEAWKGYKAESASAPQGAEGEIDFILPGATSTMPLKIFVYKPASWDSADPGQRGTEIARSQQYVFGYKTWDSPPPDLVQITDKEIADRIKTFKLL